MRYTLLYKWFKIFIETRDIEGYSNSKNDSNSNNKNDLQSQPDSNMNTSQG